jgi:hypothetical protein
MLLTQEEARTKRCQESFGPPMATIQPASISPNSIFYANALGGVGPFVSSPTNCIASGCMAWRWSDHTTIDGNPLGSCGKAGIIYRAS